MSDGTKLAIAILVMWIAMVFFFFAFHPAGVKGVQNPGQMLKWLVDEFTRLAGGTPSPTPASLTSATDTQPYLGYTDIGSGGNANQGGVQLA